MLHIWLHGEHFFLFDVIIIPTIIVVVVDIIS